MDITSPAIAPSYDDTAIRKNLALLIQLRWIAVVGQVLTILVVHFGLRIALPLGPMFLVLVALVVLNLVSIGWLRGNQPVNNGAVFAALLLDVIALSAQLYLSGGASNPFIALYLVQIVLAAVLLDAESSWILVGATFICFIMLTWFNRPLVIPPRYDELYQYGMFLCFALDAALLVAFVTRMNLNLRERDARLAELKQQAAEEDHIVRMGLLASGAAHELGTPLASVSVILGDWRRMPEIARRPDMVEELEEMQAAVQRCKTILHGILRSAGEARGEAPEVTTLHRFLRDIVQEWTERHQDETLHYQPGDLGADVNVVSDPALRQVVTNLLENANEVSPQWIGLSAERRGDLLRVEVTDAGPGFTAEMLASVGKPYHSTKSRQGAGLGLFLVVNVIRKLGGSVAARNREAGGAAVTIELPLAALAFDRGRA
ncbi:MAG TPA: ATP-binding protein [Povalibacter sp.]|uniref:ATP-binding protein n=1 Tax=Povalibacter sp. TaxID=1962978 RepID=UPI002BDFBC83|nr:ATP-binding protein [Povalibacter sp.]HMN43905.1 ATP-binding protein [Povalibacter sp.]